MNDNVAHGIFLANGMHAVSVQLLTPAERSAGNDTTTATATTILSVSRSLLV